MIYCQNKDISQTKIRVPFMGYRSTAETVGFGHDSRETSLARSRPRLAARSAELARSVFLIITFSRNDARLGRHLAVLIDHCGDGGIRTHEGVAPLTP